MFSAATLKIYFYCKAEWIAATDYYMYFYPFFGFLLNFGNGLLWHRSGHPILLVAQEIRLCAGESKSSNILTIACVQAIGHSFFQIYFIFGAKIGGYDDLSPYLFMSADLSVTHYHNLSMPFSCDF